MLTVGRIGAEDEGVGTESVVLVGDTVLRIADCGMPIVKRLIGNVVGILVDKLVV